jgi:phosphatidylglycerol:prolipoprotein diacylglycerol transferase
MLIHPNPDPVAFYIVSWPVYWYGIMYGIAFLQFILLGGLRIKQPHIAAQGWTKDHVSDIIFYGMIGVVVGGRLGEVLFYRPAYFWENPAEIPMTWLGGMSFHGGFIGVMVAMWFWSRKYKKHIGDVFDFIAPLVPLGYAAGRFGNFINHELPGRAASADLPWAMQWPGVDYLVHPSPLYQTIVDGLLLFAILWLFARTQKPRWATGALFCMLYGFARFFTEYFRVPDWETSFAGMSISSGQVLSLPMILVGAAVLVWAYKYQEQYQQPPVIEVTTTAKTNKKQNKKTAR